MDSIDARHHSVGSAFIKGEDRPDRFVWVVPTDAVHHGCLHAYSGGEVVGRSAPISIAEPLHKREMISEVADMSGPWFDGIAAMASKNNTDVFVSEAKSKSMYVSL